MLLSGGTGFTVLIIIFPHVALTAGIPPPTHVNVNCKNLETKVSWGYDELLPQTMFSVEINSSKNHLTAVTPDLQYNLTAFIWRSQWNYLDFYYVTVTALQGVATSEPAQSQTFTFNRMRVADIICKLDFPPVSVTADKSGNTVTFENPLITYRELNDSRNLKKAFFKFTVSSDQRDYVSECDLKKQSCKYDLPSSEGAQACVTLRGWLDYGNGVENVEFHQTDRVCTTGSESETKGAQVLALTLTLTFILLFILTLTPFCVLKGYKKKPIPKPSRTVLDVMPHSGPSYQAVVREDFNPVTVESKQVCSKNLEDQSLHDDDSAAEGGEGSRSGACENPSQTFKYTDGAILENSGDQQQEDGDLTSSEHGSEQEEQEEDQPMERSHYDRRHV